MLREFKNDLKFGKLKVLNSASKIVDYCLKQPVFQEVNVVSQSSKIV